MTEAHRMLMHIKERFRNDPKTYNHFEMNLKILYRDNVRRERKLNLDKPADQNDEEGDGSKQEAPDLFKKMTSGVSKTSLRETSLNTSPQANTGTAPIFNNNPL
jgi:hypothetical protein